MCGASTSRQLLERGNTVLITGRDEARLAATRAKLPGLHTFVSDVADPTAVDALFEQATTRFPAINVLINNAGQMRVLNLRAGHNALDDLTREIQTNLIAPTSYCASLSDVLRLFAEGVSAGLFPSTPLRPVTPAPRPLTPPQPAPSRNRSRGWILPPSMLTPPVAASPQAAPADAPGRATRCRPFVIPPDLLAELQRRSTP